jgi:hypothetical protein
MRTGVLLGRIVGGLVARRDLDRPSAFALRSRLTGRGNGTVLLHSGRRLLGVIEPEQRQLPIDLHLAHVGDRSRSRRRVTHPAVRSGDGVAASGQRLSEFRGPAGDTPGATVMEAGVDRGYSKLDALLAAGEIAGTAEGAEA